MTSSSHSISISPKSTTRRRTAQKRRTRKLGHRERHRNMQIGACLMTFIFLFRCSWLCPSRQFVVNRCESHADIVCFMYCACSVRPPGFAQSSERQITHTKFGIGGAKFATTSSPSTGAVSRTLTPNDRSSRPCAIVNRKSWTGGASLLTHVKCSLICRRWMQNK